MRNFRVAVLLAACLVPWWAERAQAACSGSSPNRNAASASRTDVNDCVNAAASGDTIRVPAGTATWSGPIRLPSTKDLTLLGATVVNCTGTAGTDSYGCSTTDQTTITCSPNCFEVSLSASQRVTGFTLRTTTGDEVIVLVDEQNVAKNFRVDHNHLISTAGWAPIRGKGQTNAVHPQGIWDHNRLEDVAIHTNGTLHQLVEGPYQHQIWAQDTPLGNSSQVVYVEDNHFSGTTGNINSTDGNYAGRVVIRGNRFSGQTYMEFHSPQGDNRGFQRWEVYNNILKDPSTVNCFFGLGSIRGGTGVFFNNLMSGNLSDCNFDLLLDNVRSEWTSAVGGLGPCNGSSPWDQNSGSQGWRCRDQIGIGRDLTLWNHTTTPAWNQEVKPAYFWNNSKSGTSAQGGPGPITVTVDPTLRSPLHLVANRDFYTATSSFNGTSGVGAGPLSSRPATCTAGVAYWATDQGEWNSTNGTADGRLFKCTATNTWTAYYTPYVYPHPWTNPTAQAPLLPPTAVSAIVR